MPDGSEVQVIVPDAVGQTASFADRYAAYIGAADDLPADLATNLDHYDHGHLAGARPPLLRPCRTGWNTTGQRRPVLRFLLHRLRFCV